jgi:hypothetical protein
MKLEKFDLEKALNGAKVVTRDGREVKELTKFEGLKNYPLVGVLDTNLHTWTTQGMFNSNHEVECIRDLFLVVEPNRVWVNIYQHDGIISIGSIYKTKKEARGKAIDHVDMKYIKTIEITDEP